MHTAVGVFSAREAAESAFKELLANKVPHEEIVFLTRSEPEGASVAKGLGATVGGFMGFATGMSAGVGVAVLLAVPGIGQVAALGIGAAALLGLTGVGAGSVLAKAAHHGNDDAAPTREEACAEDVAFFREVLAEGRSLVVVRSDSDEAAGRANEVLNRLGIALRENTPIPLQMSTRDVGDVAIIDMQGRITLGEGSTALRERVRQLVDKGQRKILLNLHNVGYIDSSGLGELVKAYTTVRNHGGHLKLVDVSERVLDLLQLTRLHLVLEIEADEASAMQAFHAAAAS